VVGSPVISAPYGSSQLPVNKPTLTVTAGATAGMSSDQAVQASPISPGPVSGYLNTGAGQGSVDHWSRKPGQQPAGG
jgi:hypothetical protein